MLQKMVEEKEKQLKRNFLIENQEEKEKICDFLKLIYI